MDTVLYWLLLKNIHGVGNHLIKRLFDQFSSPETIFQASYKELICIPGVSRAIAETILGSRITDHERRELDAVSRKGLHLITLSDKSYPSLLRHIADPPPCLYIAGTMDPAPGNIAVVGSRNASRYGISTARQLSYDLAHVGISVTSGMARGVDTAAHNGSLQGSGRTYAVLGSGLDIIYPPENRSLFNRIADKGAVLSEFPLGTPPKPYHFPRRNRIISGMTAGTIVVEASPKSGSLITARLAAEQGREVFAVPGSIQSRRSSGAHQLLKQGAKLVETVADVIEEIGSFLSLSDTGGENQEQAPPKKQPVLDSDESIVFKALEPYPTHFDDLVRSTGVHPAKLAGILLKLELEGLVAQSPGNLFSSCEEETCRNH